MQFKKYIRSLLPSFEKSRILDDIAMMREELNEHTLPPYEAASKYFKEFGFKSKEIQKFDKDFDKGVDFRSRGNYVTVTHQALVNANDILTALDRMVDKYYANEVVREGLSYMKVNILQYLESVSFALRYSRKLLLWTLIEETNQVKDSKGNPAVMPRPEIEWLAVHQDAFFRIVGLLTERSRDIQRTLEKVPDMRVDPDTIDVAVQTVGLTKLDPYKLGFLPPRLNPIYHVRIAIAEWQVNRIKAAREEKKALEYRLMNLQALQTEEEYRNDAKLQQNIEYTEMRLEKLNYKLRKMEEDHA